MRFGFRVSGLVLWVSGLRLRGRYTSRLTGRYTSRPRSHPLIFSTQIVDLHSSSDILSREDIPKAHRWCHRQMSDVIHHVLYHPSSSTHVAYHLGHRSQVLPHYSTQGHPRTIGPKSCESSTRGPLNRYTGNHEDTRTKSCESSTRGPLDIICTQRSCLVIQHLPCVCG